MIRVEPYDANFAYAESDRVRASIVTAYAFNESDTSTPDLVEWLAARASGIAPLRQRMVRAFGDIGDAYWSDSPEFDATDHIEELPSVSWDGLRTLLADLHSTGFDRSRPLWQIYIIRKVTGIAAAEGPCTVVIVKFHHAMTDGMGAADIARRLFAEKAERYSEQRPASRMKVSAIEAARLFVRPFLVVADLWRLIVISRSMSKDRAAGLWEPPAVEARMSSVTNPCGPDRVADVIFTSVSQVRQIADQIGDVSVNDVVLASIGAALARHIGETGLVASVPVSAREHLSLESRNALAFGLVELRPDLPLTERSRAIRASVRRERARFALPSYVAMYTALPRLPGFVYRWLDRMGQARDAKKARPQQTQLRVSTIPKGPADRWVLADSPVLANFGVTPLSDGLGVNHTVARIGDVLAIGVIADPQQFSNFDGYLSRVRGELARVPRVYADTTSIVDPA